MKPSSITNFWTKVDRSKGFFSCWEWQGYIDPLGYGYYHPSKSVKLLAHRFAYTLFQGEIPKPLVLDHLCRNRACVNPSHLEPVSNAENILRGNGQSAVNARKTHCPKGHEFTPENTRIDKKGARRCRECERLYLRDAYAKGYYTSPERRAYMRDWRRARKS